MDLQEYAELPNYAYKLRKMGMELNEQNLFKNISYLNKFIEPRLLDKYKKDGDAICIN